MGWEHSRKGGRPGDLNPANASIPSGRLMFSAAKWLLSEKRLEVGYQDINRAIELGQDTRDLAGGGCIISSSFTIGDDDCRRRAANP
jgi:hypothetical protein